MLSGSKKEEVGVNLAYTLGLLTKLFSGITEQISILCFSWGGVRWQVCVSRCIFSILRCDVITWNLPFLPRKDNVWMNAVFHLSTYLWILFYSSVMGQEPERDLSCVFFCWMRCNDFSTSVLLIKVVTAKITTKKNKSIKVNWKSPCWYKNVLKYVYLWNKIT